MYLNSSRQAHGLRGYNRNDEAERLRYARKPPAIPRTDRGRWPVKRSEAERRLTAAPNNSTRSSLAPRGCDSPWAKLAQRHRSAPGSADPRSARLHSTHKRDPPDQTDRKYSDRRAVVYSRACKFALAGTTFGNGHYNMSASGTRQ